MHSTSLNPCELSQNILNKSYYRQEVLINIIFKKVLTYEIGMNGLINDFIQS